MTDRDSPLTVKVILGSVLVSIDRALPMIGCHPNDEPEDRRPSKAAASDRD
jgi:hypothetical protein